MFIEKIKIQHYNWINFNNYTATYLAIRKNAANLKVGCTFLSVRKHYDKWCNGENVFNIMKKIEYRFESLARRFKFKFNNDTGVAKDE